MEILLTGASGFVGSLLLPRLTDEGHSVRALSRSPELLTASLLDLPGQSARTTVLPGDAITGQGLEDALRDVEVAYYLIHSMEPTASRSSFEERERLAASNFAAAARAAGVRRIVYLGGLMPRWDVGEPAHRARASRHLSSRLEVERVLLEAIPDSIALRASIVIGARSRSFRLLVRLVERMPVIALPAWQRYRTSPIDQRDVIAMLAACAASDISGEVLEVGGPDVLSYGQMLEAIAESLMIGRPQFRLKVNLTPIAGRVAAAIATEDPELVIPLMEGLQGDLLPREDGAAERLGVSLHSFDSAVEHALGEWERAEPLAAR